LAMALRKSGFVKKSIRIKISYYPIDACCLLLSGIFLVLQFYPEDGSDTLV
jgi:hypothetical protein